MMILPSGSNTVLLHATDCTAFQLVELLIYLEIF